jgi:hypothetical protein
VAKAYNACVGGKKEGDGETWCLILRAEYKLRLFENDMLMRIFGPKMDEVTGHSRKFTMRMSVTCMPHEIL